MMTQSKFSANKIPMTNELSQILDRDTICMRWSRLWSSFGFSDYQWSSRAAKVEDYTRKLFENKAVAYKEQLRKRRALLIQSIEDYDELIERTGLPTSIDKCSFDQLKLREQELLMDRRMQDLLSEEGKLLQKKNELEYDEKQLCFLLNSTPMEFDENKLMTIVERNQRIQEHIQMLNDLKEHRQKEISSHYLKLKDYVDRLEWEPTSPTMKHMLAHEFEHCLTADCLNEIQTTLNHLEICVENQKQKFLCLRDQINHLYERLGKSLETIQSQAYHTDTELVTASVIRELENEVRLCREERMKNGKEYCQLTNQQILDLIERAYLGKSDRSIVAKLNQEPLSSDVLDAYDAEYDRILKLYECRKPVLDAYEKWLNFWNDFVAFTKASTDPARFRTRGYNAQAEGRKRKKFLRELPLVEQEFLNFLSEFKNQIFLIDDIPIQEKFEQAHLQVPASALPSNAAPRTMITVTASPRTVRTPVQPHTLAVTPARSAKKRPLGLATAFIQRTAKTPAASSAKKLASKTPSHTEKQTTRAKPRPPPPAHQTPTHPITPMPVHPPASTDDQVLDFSLLHTVKNIHGQVKVMTSTPNSSLVVTEPTKKERIKTAHNIIDRRRSKRRTNRVLSPVSKIPQTPDETVPCT